MPVYFRNKYGRLTVLFASLLLAPAMVCAAISTVDLVSVRDGHVEETLFYYENNWKAYREEALDRGFISGYRLLVDTSTPGSETLLLITEYPDDQTYQQREENFRTIMSTDGPRLLNDVEPGDFRAVEFLGVFRD